MLDQITEWLRAFEAWMERGTWTDLGVVLLIGFLNAPVLISLHELGHAIAVVARRLPLKGLKVGDETLVTLTAGAFRVEMGRVTGNSDVGGYVVYDGRTASPLDVLLISLAGPAASALGVLATAWLAWATRSVGMVSLLLGLATLGGLWGSVGNLVPRRLANGWMSDGLSARGAWREMRDGVGAAPSWRDPNELTSEPPPDPPRAG
jgi:hypothetical protein